MSDGVVKFFDEGDVLMLKMDGVVVTRAIFGFGVAFGFEFGVDEFDVCCDVVLNCG